MGAKAKLTDEQVKWIRRRVRRGDNQTDLATEFGVDRKTIRRRLDALELAETEKEQRAVARRLRRQVTQQRRMLIERDKAAGRSPTAGNPRSDERPAETLGRGDDPYLEWLDTPKNLSGRALAEAQGLVRLRNADGTRCSWVDRVDADALIEDGWTLA